MSTPPFDLGLAAAFTVVGEERHLGRAAERLETDRIALRAEVAALESQLGTALVRLAADGPGVDPDDLVLTPAGSRFLAASTEIVARAGLLEAALRAGEGGILHLAVGHTVRAMAHDLIDTFAAANPGTELRVECMHGSQATQALAESRVDIAFDLPTSIPLGCRYLPIDRTPLVLVAARGHHLAREGPVPWGELEGEPVVVAPAGIVDSWNVLIRTALQRAGVSAREIRGPMVAHPHELIPFLERGEAVMVAEGGAFDPWPATLTRSTLLPIQELEGGMAWRPDAGSTAVPRFVAWAMSCTPADPPLGPGGPPAVGLAS